MKIAWVYLDKRGAAIDALKDYTSMVFILEHHADVEEELRESLTSVKSAVLTGMPVTHNPLATETRMAASLDEIDVLKERYRRALEYMEWFHPAWDALSEDERFVLTEFYGSEDMQTSAVDAIAMRYCIERSSAYRRKNRALARLTTLLYGK